MGRDNCCTHHCIRSVSRFCILPPHYRDETRMESRSRSIEMIGVEAVPCSCKERPAGISQNPSQLRWPKHHRHATGRSATVPPCERPQANRNPPWLRPVISLRAAANRIICILRDVGWQHSKVITQIVVVDDLAQKDAIATSTHPGQIVRTLPVSTMLGRLRYVTKV